MNTNEITRRQLLHAGAVAASLAAAGRLPLLAATAKTGSGIDRPDSPYAVKPIRSHLTRFTPSTGDLSNADKYTLAYDIIHWAGGTVAVSRAANPIIGKLSITRAAGPDTVTYNVRQTTAIGGVDNVIKANIKCNPGVPDSVRRWTLDRHSTTPDGRVDPISRLRETGSCKSGRIDIDNGAYKCDFTTDARVAAQWTILGLLAGRADQPLDTGFTLLQDLSLCKPDQHLRRQASIPVTVKAGRTIELTNYVQTGNAVLPINYLVDSRGLPQLITAAMLSWALTDCTTA